MTKTTQKALSSSERQRRYTARLRAEGWRRLGLWLAPGVDPKRVRKYVKKLNSGG